MARNLPLSDPKRAVAHLDELSAAGNMDEIQRLVESESERRISTHSVTDYSAMLTNNSPALNWLIRNTGTHVLSVGFQYAGPPEGFDTTKSRRNFALSIEPREDGTNKVVVADDRGGFRTPADGMQRTPGTDVKSLVEDEVKKLMQKIR
jgi:hypothetical protein